MAGDENIPSREMQGLGGDSVAWQATKGRAGLPYAPVGIGWFVGSLVVLFLVLRRGHRWLTKLVEIAAVPEALIDPDIEEMIVREPFDAAAFHARVAAADARHEAPSATHDDP